MSTRAPIVIEADGSHSEISGSDQFPYAAIPVGTTSNTIMAGDDSRVLGLLQVESDRQEPTGFIAEPGPPTDSTVGFVNATRTFTIAPTGASFSFYQSGTKYTISSSQNIVISNVEGVHFIYFNGGVLAETTTFSADLYLKYVYVHNLYWDATNAKQILFGDERHGCVMDGASHLHDHSTLHTLLQSGGGLTTLFVDASGNLDNSIQFGVAETIQWDEDLYWDLSGRTSTATISNYYRLGSSNIWRVGETNSFPVVNTGSGRAAYNLLTGSTWSLSEITNTNYGLVHVFSMNDATRRFGTIMGQADYSTEANARNAVLTEVSSLILTGMPSQEWKFLGSLIIQTSNAYGNSVKSRFVSVDTEGTAYVDLRTTMFPTSGTSGIPAGVSSINTRTGSVTLTGSDIPLANATTQGAMPALTGLSGQFLDYSGAWSTPAGSGGGITALTGDVTASGTGSVTATIANNAVTNAKLAQAPTLTLKGNNTGGTANVSDLTVAQVQAMMGATVGAPLAFTNANLVAGVLTVSHGLNQLYIPAPTIYNNSNQVVFPLKITAVDVNTCTIDLSKFGTITGTWNLYIAPVGITSTVLANDPTLGGASPSTLVGATEAALQTFIKLQIQQAIAFNH